MPNQFYIPGLPENLQGILYTPDQSQAKTKQLRQQYAGNPAMQQKLVVDDRYWQGREMAQDNPLAALGALIGSVPYDAAKLAYFHGPQSVKKGLQQLTEKLFPGEAFNDQTTSRPSRAGTGAQMQGTVEGTYGYLRDKLEALNSLRAPDSVIDKARIFTEDANYRPTLANRLLGDNMPDVNMVGVPEADRAGQLRANMAKWGLKNAVANGVDFTGTFKKSLATILQTVNPDFDTRQQFDEWMPDRTMSAIAPGYHKFQAMSPEAAAKQNAQISELLKTWPKHDGPAPQWPINQRVPVLNIR